MTQFGQDASHYDELITEAAGLVAYTHKLTDGNHYYEDAEYGPALNGAKALGIPILGTYHVLWPGDQASINAQIDWWVARADTLTPWWRTWDGPDRCFIWQLDCEPFDYLTRAPNKTEIEQAITRLLSHGIRLASIGGYCPEWVYHDTLGGLRAWLWASNYGSNPHGDYKAIYPGDDSARWHPYPADGDPPLALQYGSNATIGNQTTCDANGFRFPTVTDLIARLRGTTTMGAYSDRVDPDALTNDYRTGGIAGLVSPITVPGIAASVSTDGKAYPARTEKLAFVEQFGQLRADVTAIKTALAQGVPVKLDDETIDKLADVLAPKLAAAVAPMLHGTWAMSAPEV